MRWLPALLFCVSLISHAQASPPDASVTMYHADAGHSGNFTMPGLDDHAAQTLHRDRTFTGRVDGAVYAQPLYWHPAGTAHGLVIVATEKDQVAALDADTGKTVWQVSLGTPAPRSTLACGDIHPLGITGTPVIDPKTAALYVDAVVDQGGKAQHLVFGLNLTNGTVLPGWPVSMQQAMQPHGVTLDPRIQDQRGALALLDHRLFVPYGGNDGDCGPYRGIVAGLDLAKPGVVAAWATRGTKGGIWAPGGISTAGNRLFFTTGNTVTGAIWADGEAVFGLGPNLRGSHQPTNFFTPTNWKQLDNRDLDMSGVGPLPINLPTIKQRGGTHRLIALGKDGLAYLLHRNILGGIGGQITATPVAHAQIITAPATFPAAGRTILVFQARHAICPDKSFTGGLAAISITATTITPLWCAKLDGRGSPIVTTTNGHANPIVWIDGAQGDNHLHAFDGITGKPLYTSNHPIPGVAEFQTILAAHHRLYLAASGHITAFHQGTP